MFYSFLYVLQLFELGAEGGDQETDGELLAETEEMPYECGIRQKYPMLFDDPVPVQVIIPSWLHSNVSLHSELCEVNCNSLSATEYDSDLVSFPV